MHCRIISPCDSPDGGLLMNAFTLYRRRLMPDECILLKDDIIVSRTENTIVTSWSTINYKSAFQYGASCYYLKEGYKVSKFYRADGSLFCWYCDIVQYDFDEMRNSLTVTDLLADVIISPDGAVKVVDLDELAEALEQGILSTASLKKALLQLSNLLSIIYSNKLCELTAPLDEIGL